ncbi:geranylgeranyl pyrophosphate synthase [Penicillium bovifimosum]|uniref:Geranylgeranyl pyrophosphate synthase n=1 Tax=Penicillium bovifimosum TaxID=126998 RepID=A0A9W9L5Z7_9EURO|nr:geranylgeranyl pyrophosphate synthase [Penicillium bovifimosum]KAJ5138841.1 geranylgeranyl pyrophosphate synthase [Penicillium bovifimosum]
MLIPSLPSKGFREAFIDALNVWLALPDSSLQTIKLISQKLHTCSLMLDDIEDSSPLRRGKPATHTVFGPASTINSANWILIDVMGDVQELQTPQCMDIVIEELRNLFVGQSFDLYWTQQGECPTEEEYLEMVSQKTGGLFNLLARLMKQCTQSLHLRAISLDFVSLLGQYFQIRDDYMNLIDDVYTEGKGFCEDLDEGKFSFPIVHAWHCTPPDLVMRGIIREGKASGSLSVPHKKMILSHLHEAGSMEYTLQAMKKLQIRINNDLEHVEKEAGCENWVMRLLVHKLFV